MELLRLPEPPWNAPGTFDHINTQLDLMTTLDRVTWTVRAFAPTLTLASSFGAEDMVLLDMWAKSEATPIDVFCLDTGLLFPQTYDLINEVENKYGIQVRRVIPQLSVSQQALQFGPNLWERDPDTCCQLRKVNPLSRQLIGYRAWMTGIRRDQTINRRQAPLIGWDSTHNLVKVNPLAPWTYTDVLDYLTRHNVPFNPLHLQGYPSIGCQPCTKPVIDERDPRSGRWQGKEKTECGLHL